MNQLCQASRHRKRVCVWSLGVFLAVPTFAQADAISNIPAINQDTFVNPIYEQADPWITQKGGRYFACFAEGTRGISVQISDQLTVLGPINIVWRPPKTGPASRELWAPELHPLDGHWYIYFAADDGENRHHHAWVLESAGDDPLGPYALHGPLYTGDDPALVADNRWAIDQTVFELDHRLYAIWSGWQDDRDIQYLYIAPMRDPVTMAGPRVRLCANNDYPWERVAEQGEGRGLNEAPEVLQHDGRTFLAYSCSGSWQPSYKIGMLELQPGGDPLNPTNWKKFPEPVFQSSETTFGVGHNSFVKSPDATQDWLVYHAKWGRSDGWQRTVFTQPFYWRADGTPDLGRPVAAGMPLSLPAGERVPRVAGGFDSSFAQRLAGWAYYGNQRMIGLDRGWLHLGGLTDRGASDFRTGEKVVINGGDWTNFSATVRIHWFEQAGEAGLLFRVQQAAVGCNAQCGYFAGLAAANSHVVLGFTDGSNWRELASAAIGGYPPETVTLTVEAKGKHLVVRVQGKELIETNDATFSAGSIGLRVVDTHAAFTGLRVRTSNIAGIGN